VDEDVSGLTCCEEWDPTESLDSLQMPVTRTITIDSSELRADGFKVREVFPPVLETASRSGRYTCGAVIHHLEGMGPKRFILSVDDDTEFESRCVSKWVTMCWCTLTCDFWGKKLTVKIS